eukprot:gene13200-17688_t
MNSFENQVGITSFISHCKGFRGILKERFSDFIVREVTTENEIVHLNSINGEELERASFQLEENFNVSSTPLTVHNIQDVMTEFKEILHDKLSSTDCSNLTRFITNIISLNNIDSNDSNEEKNEIALNEYTGFQNCDKKERTKIHQLVKKYMGSFVDSLTVQVDGVSNIKIILKNVTSSSSTTMNDNRNKNVGNHNDHSNINNFNKINKRSSNKWSENLGNYLEFTLLKENVDTMTAISTISKVMRLKPGSIAYNGTKDKRGVTTQKCTIYRRKPSDFTRINNYNAPPIMRVGDFRYVHNPCKLGGLNGNRFELILRSIKNDDTVIIHEVCQSIAENGFINYFGLQRFGKGGSKSHEIGCNIYKSDWRACVDMLFTPREGDKDEIEQAKKLYIVKDYRNAIPLLPNQMNNEKIVLQKLLQNPNDYMNAYQAMSKNTRLICAHSYQSCLWNKAVSKRIELYGLSCVIGDLVVMNASETLNKFNDNLDDDASVNDIKNSGEESNIQEDNNKIDSIESIKDLIHIITEDDILHNRYTIHDIVLPLPGSESIFPQNDIGQYLKQLLQNDGLSFDIFSNCHPTYRMKGSYRKIIQHPIDFTYNIINYDHPQQEIALTELHNFRKSNTNNISKEYKISSVDVNLKQSDVHETKPIFTSLQLKFTLPQGTYATMLLRELTKESTESQFQASLTADENKKNDVTIPLKGRLHSMIDTDVYGIDADEQDIKILKLE